MSLPFLIALSAALHFYIGARIVPGLPDAAGWLLAAWLVLSTVLTPVGLIARRWLRPPLADRLTWAGMLAMGLFSSLFVFTLLRDLLLLLASLAAKAGLEVPAAFAPDSAIAVAVLALLATVLGLANARRTAQVVRVDVKLAPLPAALEGFRIVQISDIHVGPTIKGGYLDAIVDRVNALEADVVAITGDLVDGTVADLAQHVAPLARLRARHGTYFVTGNHEYYSGVHGWVAELDRLGVRVLHNEHVVLQHAGEQLVLAGVTDVGGHHFDPAHRSDPAAAAHGAPPDAVKVLLAHQPRSAAAAARAGFDLQLSGHTHGGQFFPWSLFVPLQQPFTAGLHQLDRMWVYVSRGTGYWGPPKRIGAPSEISEIRLAVSV
ncbi:metallophosphoesterase [Ramlibacter sp. XY19]|uniref:metallophosphoesterase n=1 Tax=Ramlibacter paludis TaxID=2908000 RepID=UPI0023DCDC85|nr:metallophosphoesterase [Ramlibacter paludis]MCG2595697.1 metallophosphoesterase [Ramlibacter paludis]